MSEQDEEQLAINIVAKLTDLEKSMKRAEAVTTKTYDTMQRNSTRATRRMETDMVRSTARINQALAQTSARVGEFGKAFATSLIAAFSVKAVSDLVDSAVKIQNALKVTGLSGQQLTIVYDQLFASAQKNAAPLEALVTLYSRMSSASKELNANQSDMLKFTDGIATALRVSGQSAQESAGALLQLSQALGGGVIQAQEYNSLLDGGRPILQAVAAGLKEAGGSVSKLTALVKSGKVPSEAFFRAFLAGLPTLQRAAESSEETVSQSLQRIQNVLIDTAGRFNTSTRASELFGRIAAQVASEVNSIDFDKLITQIEAVISALNRGAAAFGSFLDAAGRELGLQKLANDLVSRLPGDTTVKDYFGGALTIVPQDAIQSRIDDAFNAPSTNNGALTAEQIRAAALARSAQTYKAGRLPADNTVQPVSLSDFQLPASSSSNKGGKSKSGADDFQREVEALKARTGALQETYAAQAKLNPLDADYAVKVTAIEKATELLTAAQKGGKEVGKELSDVNKLLYGDLSDLTPAAQQQALVIRKLSLGYADASDKLDKLKASQDAAAQSAKDMLQLEKDTLSGALSDIRSALEDGKITWSEWGDIAANALNKVADKLQDMLVNQLFSGSGLNLFGSLFGGVTAAVGGGMASAAGAARVPHVAAAPLVTAARPSSAAVADVHVTVGLRKDRLNIEPEMVEIAQGEAARAARGVQNTFDQYRKNGFHRDWEAHAKNRHVLGRHSGR